MRRTGFTLVELLMVVAIIAVLAGLLIPLIGYAKSAAKNAKCEAQLGTIKAALALFKDANGFYPEKFMKGTKDVYADTFKPGGKYQTADQVTTAGGWDDIAEALLQQLQTVDRDNFRDLSALRDPFTGGGAMMKVLRYRPAKFYPLQAHSNWVVDSEEDTTDPKNPSPPPPNPDSYQLWSAGADGRDQYGERQGEKVNGLRTGRKSDDITNWKSL